MEFSNCIICDSKESFNIIEQVNDRFSKKDIYLIQECSCGMIMLNPRKTEEKIFKHYNLNNYHPNNRSSSMFGCLYKFAQRLNNEFKLKIIKKYFKTGKALDFGGGDGQFNAFLTKHNWLVDTYEPYIKSRLFRGKVINDLKKIETNKYDLITMFHSIEHIHKIDETLKKIKSALKKKCILIIAIPNHNAYERFFLKEKWVAYDAPRHLYHFNEKTIIMLLKKYGFQLIEKKPLLLDTFYNIIMSSQFNFKSVLKSTLLLIKSIFAIISNNDRSSSLIFTFRKYD